jgi:hypothetical protein
MGGLGASDLANDGHLRYFRVNLCRARPRPGATSHRSGIHQVGPELFSRMPSGLRRSTVRGGPLVDRRDWRMELAGG